MSSNVLKSLSDCYNFNDDSKGGKTKGKQRPRLVTYSSTSKSSKVKTTSKSTSAQESKSVAKDVDKRDPKWRCDGFQAIIKSAVWLNDIRADNRSAIDVVLEMLFKHMDKECKCVNICSTHLLIGNTFFERFLFNQKEFENKVIKEENNCSQMDTNSDCNQSQKVVINDIPVNKESKLDANVMSELVNIRNMSDLLSPLEQALDHWNRAYDLNIKFRVLSEEVFNAFKIYYNLSSVFQIYVFYDRIQCRLKAAELMNKFCRYYGHKESEMSLTANYYLVKTYIELGALDKATDTLTRTHTTRPSEDTQKMPETFGKSLNLLANCELDLLKGRTEKAAKTLKRFLESDYLKKLTINRYFVKGLALLMASKFTSKHFNYSNNFQEFLEPIQMSVCILKRWHSWLSSTSKANNENQVVNAGDLDPIWYKFAVLNFAFEAMQLSSIFYLSVEMPIDSFFYYNALFKLGRRYCAAVRISKLLIIGSQLDLICDHKYWAQTKLDNALLCFRPNNWSSDSGSVFTSSSSVSTISPDTRRAIEGSYSRRHKSMKSDPELELLEINSIESSFYTEKCEHNNKSSLWELKKKLRQIDNDFSDSEDSIFVSNNKTITHQTFTSEDDYQKEILDLFLIKIEINFYRLLVTESDPKYVLTQIIDIHKNSVESYATNVLKDKIQEFLVGYDLNDLLENYSNYKSLKFKIIETIARLQMENKEYEEVINTCYEMNGWKCYSYVQRVIQSNLLYFEAFSKWLLYKDKHNINEDNVWIEFNNHLMQSMSTQSSTIGQSLTPPRHQKIKTIVPKAPKQKAFKTEEMNDYMTALSKCVYEESIANTSKSVEIHSRFKTHSKLNLENDSELRSVSVTEVNPIEEEVTEVSKSKPKSQPKPTKRMTRSHTSSITSQTSEDNNSSKVDKRIQRIDSKPSKTKTSSEVSVDLIDLTNDSEDLDEVFQKILVINDDIKGKKKFSKESDLDLESIVCLLKQIFDLVSTHPSSKLFVSVHKLLTQIYSTEEKLNEDCVGYHFSESMSSTYRYRNLFIAEKKRKLNRISKYDLKSIEFKEGIIDSNNSYKTFTECLPNDWRIVQICVLQNDSKIPELMVCRFQRDRKPVFLKLKSDPEKIIKYFMTHFVDIIERSNASIVNKDRETFWRLRFSLDEELMILLRSVEETWFGAFKGILLGQLQSQAYQQMCSALTSRIIDVAINEDLICKNEPLLEVLVESLPSLKYSEFRAAMKTLFNSPSDSLVSNCFAIYEQMFCEVFPIDNKEIIFTTYDISPVGLILDKSLEAFPFESLPSLQSYNQSLFRTPSLRVLALMYNTFKDSVYTKGVDESNVFYVLNPADNLAKTEEFFKQSFISMKDWKGVIGKAPEPLELKDAFDCKDGYIFFGHGAGASYYRTIPEGLDGCNINCAAIVIGCSSGKLFSEGNQLESYGTPYRFMMNGSPCYVGVLWDVTDKDIDKFSDHLLNYWFSEWKPEIKDNQNVIPITKAVSLSRKFCRLKHLIGAAPVVYGLPLISRSKLNTI